MGVDTSNGQRPWDPWLSDRDRAVFSAAGYHPDPVLGEHPALLIVDVTYEFTGDRPEPILDSIARFPHSCGAVAWDAVEHMEGLVGAARRAAVPVIYTRARTDDWAFSVASWGRKNERFRTRSGDEETMDFLNTIPGAIRPLEGDTILEKTKPSAFFGTPLIEYLVTLGIDQIVCCGTTTSGCVRATVVDAFSYGFRVAVVEECTFDRGEASHAMSLFDMQQKYAEVVRVGDVIDYFDGVTSIPGRESSRG